MFIMNWRLLIYYKRVLLYVLFKFGVNFCGLTFVEFKESWMSIIILRLYEFLLDEDFCLRT